MIQTPILILDLDNTIYPVSSVADELFSELFNIIQKPEFRISPEVYESAKRDCMRIPFQKVAEKYNFPGELITEALNHLRNLTYEDEMYPFSDYQLIAKIQATRFLVTAGFTKLQQSKIDRLGIKDDFEAIYIIDNDHTDKSKKDIFQEIVSKYNLRSQDVFVIGDDPESEIRAASELGLTSILLDPANEHQQHLRDYKVESLADVAGYLKQENWERMQKRASE